MINVILVSADFDRVKHELKIGLLGKRNMDWADANDLMTLQENM